MTIKDIAQISGYSVSTVSRALNGHPDINEKTKKKIKKVIKECKFIPNNNARRLKQSISKSIVVVVKGSFNLFFSTIIENMQIIMDKSNITSIIHYVNENDDEVKIAEYLCSEQKPIGIIFLGGNIEPFRNSFSNIKIPCVLCTTNSEILNFSNLSSVSIDDLKSSKKAIDYLFNCGHNKIGIIGGIKNSYISGLRFKGCKISFKEHNQKLTSSNYEKCTFSMKDAYDATIKLLEKNKDLTAIFAMSDIMAIGSIRAIIDMGKKVPNDISVIGFDGIELSEYYNPKLTTIIQPKEQFAQLSVQLLLDMINNKTLAKHILLETDLFKGDSVKCINTNN